MPDPGRLPGGAGPPGSARRAASSALTTDATSEQTPPGPGAHRRLGGWSASLLIGSGAPIGSLCAPRPTGADGRMLGLGRVAVHRSRFPVAHSPNSAGQGSSQGLGGLRGTAHGELDLLVDLAGQAPGMIVRPHQVRFLSDACCRAVPSQSWRVSERLDRAGEQQHRPMRNLHSRRLRSRRPAHPALPYCRIPVGRRGRVGGEGRECCANGIDRCFA